MLVLPHLGRAYPSLPLRLSQLFVIRYIDKKPAANAAVWLVGRMRYKYGDLRR